MFCELFLFREYPDPAGDSMLITKILFCVLIVICTFFYILYVPDFALVLLVVLIALPVIMFIASVILRFSIKAELVLKDTLAGKNQSFPVQLCIANKSFIPVGKAEAQIEYYNVFSNQISTFYLDMPIQPRNTQRITFQLDSKFCGIIKIKNVCIKVYDPMRLFGFRTGKNITAEIAIMPEIHDISGTVMDTDFICEESDVFSENKPGDDPSEIFDLRDYNAGDKLNRIHWKLSSKKDEFIVKEYSLPVDIPSVIFLNLRCYEDSEYTLPIFDTLIETYLSVSQLMLDNEKSHKVIYFHGRKNQFVEKIISSADDLAEVTRDMIISFNDNLFCLPPDNYLAEKSIISVSSFTMITAIPENEIFGHIDDYVEAELKNVLVVVKSQNDVSKIKCGYTDICTTPVIAGRISSSIKDIEL